MPTLEATCSLDLGCEASAFAEFCAQHPDREVVVYANTSAAVKAQADWVVTSSIALAVVDHRESWSQESLNISFSRKHVHDDIGSNRVDDGELGV